LLIRLGHSPDPDDAFMFWGLAEGEVDPRGFEFEHVLQDIQTLNEWALEGRLEVTAISLHAYPHVQDRYVLLPHGASMGSGYGPIVVAREELDEDDCAGSRSRSRADDDAFLTLQLRWASSAARGAVRRDHGRGPSGKADAGLLIHEGQLTYGAPGCSKVVDLGEWWLEETGLPLPLGANVARRDLGRTRCASSPTCSPSRSAPGSTTASAALEYALQFGRGLDDELADRFVGMYVNELTEDYGEEAGARSASSCAAVRRSARSPRTQCASMFVS
jgi:1,4-dihydroxy-6-naphthoate synthase